MAKKKASKKSKVEPKVGFGAAVERYLAQKRSAAKGVKKRAAKESDGTPAAKKKSKNKRGDPKDLQSMRGVVTFDTNEILILVRSTCDEAAKAYQSIAKLKTRVEDAIGKTVKINGPSFLIYQLKSHPWTIIDSFADGRVQPDEAKKLSKDLKTQAIFYANSDTAGVTLYEFYDAGKSQERFETGDEGLSFDSKIRELEPPEDGPDIYPFVDDFIKEQDAFVPGWSTLLFHGWQYKNGDEVPLDFGKALNEQTIEGFEFLSK